MRSALRVLSLALIPLAAGGMFYWWRTSAAPADGRTHTVAPGNIAVGVTISGTVRTREKTLIAAEVLAMVRRLAVQENQRVRRGEVLIELDDSVVAADMAKAQARLKVAEQYLAQLRAGPRQQEKRLAELALEQAKIKLSYAESEFKRVDALAGRGVTQTELEQAGSQLQTARTDAHAAQAKLDLLTAGARQEEIARAEAEVELAQAEIQGCQALRDKYALSAPHDGVVTARMVRGGEIVSPGQPLLRVDNVEDLQIDAQAQETQLVGIHRGSTARVLTDAYPQELLEATVTDILPRVDEQSGTVPVKLSLGRAKPAVTLMDGMAADIALISERRHDVLCVPVEAVEHRGSYKGTVQVRQGGRFVRRTVYLGLADGQMIEITSGLRAGEQVRLP